jgi:hypothetical protein
MNRAGLMVVVVAVLFAVAPSWTSLAIAAPDEQQPRDGSMAIATLIDASVKNAALMSHAASGQQPLDAALSGRDIQVIDVDRALNPDEAALLSDLLHGSEVLQMNVILVHGAAAIDGALSTLLAEHDISIDRVVAIDLADDDTARLVTVYTFPY